MTDKDRLPDDQDLKEAEHLVKIAAGMGAPIGDVEYMLAATKFLIVSGLDPRDKRVWSSINLVKFLSGGRFGHEELTCFAAVVRKIDIALKYDAACVAENFCRLLDLVPKQNRVMIDPWLRETFIKFKNLADKTADRSKVKPAQDVMWNIYELAVNQKATRYYRGQHET